MTLASTLRDIKAGLPPLIGGFGHLTFLHLGIEEVERQVLLKFHKKIQREGWSNMSPKLLAFIRLYTKLYTKTAVSESIKFNRAREIEFNFFYRLDYLYETWTTYSSCLWLQNLASDFLFLPGDLLMVFQKG